MENKNMNRSFTYIQHSQLNNSPSKYTNFFTQAQRFPCTPQPICARDSYDLHSTMMASRIISKTSTASRELRFNTRYSVSPSPDAYLQTSFIDLNMRKKKGPMPGKEKRGPPMSSNYLVPGPGSYENRYNPEKQLFYTIRSRVNASHHQPHIGPGHYNVESYEAVSKAQTFVSKYSNTAHHRLGKEKRFNRSVYETISPGPPAYSMTVRQMPKDGVFSFTKSIKSSSYLRKNIYPGPGSYSAFSQFGDKQIGSMAHLPYSSHIFGPK